MGQSKKRVGAKELPEWMMASVKDQLQYFLLQHNN